MSISGCSFPPLDYKRVSFSIRVGIHALTLRSSFPNISISSDMTQESESVVTIHRRPILSHHRACGFGYPFGPQALQLTIQCYPQDIFTLPSKLPDRLTRKKSVYCRTVQYFYNLWITTQPFKAPYPLNP